MSAIASIRDVEAIESRPTPSLPPSTYSLLQSAALRNPKSPALSFFLQVEDHQRAQTWTYEQLLGDITASANFFNGIGIGKDDVVAFVLPNLPETHFVIWGGQATGIVFAVNPLLEPSAIAGLLRAGGAKALVTLAPFPNTDLWQKVQSILAELPNLEHLVLVNLAERVPGLKRIVAKHFQKREEIRLHGKAGIRGAVPSRISIHNFARGVARHPKDRLLSGRKIESSDISSYFCTGGTTGLPKIAVRTHGNEVSNAWSVGHFLGDSIGPSKTVFCGLPLFHVNAVMVTGLVPFSKGAHVLLGTPQGYRGAGVIDRFWEMVKHHRINFFSGVPTLYAALLQRPIDKNDLRSLEYGLCGAAPMPVELMRSFQDRTGLKILEGYGLTEGTCVSTSNPPAGDRRIGSIGIRIPLQRMKAVVLGSDGLYQRDCEVGEVGVLTISGPNIFLGYTQESQNAGLWVDMRDGRRWLNTGDLGRIDSEGYFYLTGRKKELIIRGGHNIDPAIIEELLHRHPAVQLAAAVGRPDAHSGEVPVAYVQLRANTKTSESELLLFAKQHISERAAIPKAVRIVDSLPLTAVGKIFKPSLKTREIESAMREALLERGIDISTLDASITAEGSIQIAVSLAVASEEEVARTVLGQYPFSFSIGVGAPVLSA